MARSDWMFCVVGLVTMTTAKSAVIPCDRDPLVLCRISSEAELAAAKEIVDAWDVKRDAEKTLELATAFVRTPPFAASAFRHWALDHAAQAAFELQNPDHAVFFAIESLKLRPENPGLQLRLALFLEQRSDWSNAVLHGMQALVHSESLYHRRGKFRIDFPDEAGTTAAAAALIVRIAYSDVAPTVWSSPHRILALARLLKQLSRSLAIDPRATLNRFLESPRVSKPQYLVLALAFRFLDEGQQREVFRVWRDSSYPGTPVADPRADLADATQFYKDDVRRLMVEIGPRASRSSAESLYGGSASCAVSGCHVSHSRTWQLTGMSHMSQLFAGRATKPLKILPKNGIYQVDETTRVAFRSSGRHPTMSLSRGNGPWMSFPLALAIGSLWEQSFAAAIEGRLLLLPVQFNQRFNRWESYGVEPDEVKHQRIDEFLNSQSGPDHYRIAAKDFAVECVQCHATNARAVSDSPGVTVLEYGIGCEACHGPSKSHQSYDTKGTSAVSTFVPTRSLQYDAICLPCHTHTSVFKRGGHGEINYSGAIYPFSTSVERRSLDEYEEEVFYADGRLRRATFIGEAVRRTRCFQKGGANCGSCHLVHAGLSTPASGEQARSLLKFPPDSNRLCTGCHVRLSVPGAAVSHSRHKAEHAGGAALRCVNCHMPKTMESPSGHVRTHEFDTRPDAAKSKRFGLPNSPLSCVSANCHSSDTLDWLDTEIGKWSATYQ